MALILGKLKCYFCDGKDGLLYSVCDYGIYGEVGKRIHFHRECLQMIECEPEKFGHKMTDRALYINELMEQCIKRCNVHIAERFQKKVDSLHQAHFERMIPPKA